MHKMERREGYTFFPYTVHTLLLLFAFFFPNVFSAVTCDVGLSDLHVTQWVKVPF